MKLEDLEKYRDNEGYINIDDTGFSATIENRETRGSLEREKDWMQLEDTSVLLRTELFTDEESQNYCNYAELIFEELAKQVDFPTAHYDLIKYKGKTGVLSQDVRKNNEEFFTLSEFVKMPHEIVDCSSQPVNLEDVFPKLKNALKVSEFYPDEVFSVSQDFVKMLIFDTYTMSTDRHLENCGIIVSKGENGKKHIKFSPTFDNECCLMLDIPRNELAKLNDSFFRFESRADLQEPLISLPNDTGMFSDEEKIPDWQNTIEFLADEEIRKEFFDFAEKCSKELDIKTAIKSVEERINAPIPEIAKSTAIRSFNYRKEKIIESLMLDLSIDEKPDNYDYI